MSKPWLEWKYDLCENEIHCDGKTIALSETSIFDIKDKKEFSVALQDLAMKLSWLVERANMSADLLNALKQIAHAEMFVEHIDHNFKGAIDIAKSAISKATASTGEVSK